MHTNKVLKLYIKPEAFEASDATTELGLKQAGSSEGNGSKNG